MTEVLVAPLMEEALKRFEDHFASLSITDVVDRGQDKRSRDLKGNGPAVFATVDLDREGQQYIGKKLFFMPGTDVESMKCALMKFCEEIKLLSDLKHENVIEFVGIFYQTNGTPNDTFLLPVLVTEKMPFTLTEYIEAFQHIPEAETVTVLHDIAEGLKFLHDQMIVHGNLTSNCIRLASNFIPKIADFEFAQMLEESNPMLLVASKNPHCHTFLKDVLSFGYVIIHLTTCHWPIPVGDCAEDTDLPKFVSMMGNSFLLPIVARCLAVEEKRLTSKQLLPLLLEAKLSRR